MRRAPGGSLRFSARPLVQIISPEANVAILNAGKWLKGFSTEAAQRFATKLNQELRKLCKDNAVSPATQIHEGASVYYARPVFAYLFHTGKAPQKRSPSGAWYIFYELTDTNEDGRPDEMRVVTVLHAASQKPWEEADDDDLETDASDDSPQETG